MAYSQREDAEKINATISIALNRARTLGANARKNNLDWNDNPFPWASHARQAWFEGFSDEEANEDKTHAAQS
jgi:hypothetical protein